jgi:hypothetical protein
MRGPNRFSHQINGRGNTDGIIWDKLPVVVSNLRRSAASVSQLTAGFHKPNKKNIMSRTQRTLLITAAISGLMTGVIARAQDSGTNAPGTNAPSGDTGKHDCKGLNGCKGQGGCKGGSDNNSCKGQNSCKGKGGCKSV